MVIPYLCMMVHLAITTKQHRTGSQIKIPLISHPPSSPDMNCIHHLLIFVILTFCWILISKHELKSNFPCSYTCALVHICMHIGLSSLATQSALIAHYSLQFLLLFYDYRLLCLPLGMLYQTYSTCLSLFFYSILSLALYVYYTFFTLYMGIYELYIVQPDS